MNIHNTDFCRLEQSSRLFTCAGLIVMFRHKIRVIIVKQWKKPLRIYKNLEKLNNKYKNNFSSEVLFKVANSRLGYKQCGLNVINFILSPKILKTPNIKRGRPELNWSTP